MSGNHVVDCGYGIVITVGVQELLMPTAAICCECKDVDASSSAEKTQPNNGAGSMFKYVQLLHHASLLSHLQGLQHRPAVVRSSGVFWRVCVIQCT
jgi:hypothetical protein